ncbi:MAG TPA: clostripain-related cysteine peptidase [Candidatus Angelobacter sp.]
MANQDPANWMIMMYIAADDMLANFAVESLKQLKRAVSANNAISGNGRVVVVAQFDADGRRNIPRFVFESNSDADGSLKKNERDTIPRDSDMADPTVLRAFIDWAYSQHPADHYSLVLWGHGPELLFDDYPVLGSKQNSKKFMSPSDLGKALADTKRTADTKKLAEKGIYKAPFDVIGIDACNMSMIELMYEISSYTTFLIASQDEVPDFSFPYGSLLQAFGQTKTDPQIIDMCKKIPGLYSTAYADYILTQETRMASLTLASASLKNVTSITQPLKGLATQLLSAIDDPQKRQAIIAARANSKGFVAGLYTDLCDFCEQLRSQLCSADLCDDALVEACKAVCYEICRSDANACIVANQAAQDRHCHGVSIYFPYLTDAEKIALGAPLAPMVKGGIDVLDKGGIDVLDKSSLAILNMGGSDVLNAVRRQRIQDTEQYYDGLKLSSETQWGEFIKHGWSRCLVEDAEAKAIDYPDQSIFNILDDRYSAQQCALNLLSLYLTQKKNQQSGCLPGGGGPQPQAISAPNPPVAAALSGALNTAQPSVSMSELVVPNGNHT